MSEELRKMSDEEFVRKFRERWSTAGIDFHLRKSIFLEALRRLEKAGRATKLLQRLVEDFPFWGHMHNSRSEALDILEGEPHEDPS